MEGSRSYCWNRQEIARASGNWGTVGVKQALIKSTNYIPYDRMHLVPAPSVPRESREKYISVETQKPHGKFFIGATFFFAHLRTISLLKVTLSQSFIWKHYRWESNLLRGFCWYTATHVKTDQGWNCLVLASAKARKLWACCHRINIWHRLQT